MDTIKTFGNYLVFSYTYSSAWVNTDFLPLVTVVETTTLNVIKTFKMHMRLSLA